MFETNKNIKSTRQCVTDILNKLKDGWVSVGIIIPTYAGSKNVANYKFKNSRAEKAYRKQVEAYQQIQYLKRKRWIKTKKTEKGLMIVLTNEGAVEQIRRSAIKRPTLPGEQVCLVMFDIPEAAHTGRNHFRRFLKRLDFTMVQLSVWQSERDLFKEVLDFIKETKIQKWTEVYLAEKKY